uniref:glutathione transferase n=1 Tax=Caenorhabditis japonica TaxID=281687 RepID=A0A8R1ERI2_CAEJA
MCGNAYEFITLTSDAALTKIKDTPFGQLPVLYVDGKPLGQTYAIARYLAKQFGLAGKTSIEETEVDALADQFKDYSKDIHPYFSVLIGLGTGDLDQLRADVFVPNFKRHFAIFEKVLAASSSGFLVGDSLSWVDLLLAQHVQCVLEKDLAVIEEFGKVLAHRKKVQNLERIKQWIAKRPDYPF